MPQISFSIKDDNKSLVKSLENRTQLLEKTLSKLANSKHDGILQFMDMMKKNKSDEQKMMNKMVDAFSKTIHKMKEQKIVIEQNNDKSLANAINKRILLLEQVIKNNKKEKLKIEDIRKALPKNNNKEIEVIDRNTNILIQSFKKRGTSVIPSPS